MRDLEELQAHAIERGDDGGAYVIIYKRPRSNTRVHLRVIASHGMGWDHVSVSLPNRCPTWEEMSFIKHLFFKPDEVVMQLHVAQAAHINVHNYCLHLWRPHNAAIPLPDPIMVGF
jgi:hypothetical protein